MMTIFTAAVAALSVQASPSPAPDGYRLTWADEFEADGLPDPTRWTYDVSRNQEGWYNNELQYYAPRRPENARVENGRLIITARHESLSVAPPADWGGQAYTSARLVSTGPGWDRGFVEVKAKLPCGLGTWPAIWMLPTVETSWPLGGEIDIMEHVGHEPGVIHGTVHTGAYNHVAKTERGGLVAVADACQAFYRYQLRWTPQAVTFLVDDQPFYAFDNDGAGDPGTWPFDKPFQLILNLAVGGDMGGRMGVDDAAFPQTLEIDYVRVFQPTDDTVRPEPSPAG